jgi:DNA-binding winged helix-turn-helix (wHTH) protein
MNKQPSRFYAFGPFRFYPDEPILQCNDKPPQSLMRTVNLKGIPMDVFKVLFEGREGPGVQSSELLRQVWAARGGDPSRLTHAISTIKRLLSECDEGHEYIETIPGGYRFKASVTEGELSTSLQPDNKSTNQVSAAPKPVVSDPVINKESETGPKAELAASSSTDEIPSDDNSTAKKQWKSKAAAGLIIVVIGLLLALLVTLRRDNFDDQQRALYFYQKGWGLYHEADKLKEEKQMELAQEKYNQAEAFLRQAIQLYPDHPLYRSALGWALYDQNKRDDARQTFMSVLTLESTHREESSAHHGLGLIYEDIDNLEEAEWHLKEAVRLAPQDELEACKEDLERVLKKKQQ